MAQQLGSWVAGGIGGGLGGFGGGLEGLEGINLKTLESSEGKWSPFVVSIAQEKNQKPTLQSCSECRQSYDISARINLHVCQLM